MTRQQVITREQVRSKCYEASQRAKLHMQRALDADMQYVYAQELDKACKAAQDYNIWTTVLVNMIGA
jgi:hypothetical protein